MMGTSTGIIYFGCLRRRGHLNVKSIALRSDPGGLRADSNTIERDEDSPLRSLHFDRVATRRLPWQCTERAEDREGRDVRRNGGNTHANSATCSNKCRISPAESGCYAQYFALPLGLFLGILSTCRARLICPLKARDEKSHICFGIEREARISIQRNDPRPAALEGFRQAFTLAKV
jgi:hypothetical protein